MRTSVDVVEVATVDGPDAVRVAQRPVPEGEGVRIAVEAVGLSFPDVLRARGEYQVKSVAPYVLGSEFAGTVIDASAGAFAPGDRVMGRTDGEGAAAAEILVSDGQLVRMPDDLSAEQGAGALFNYETSIVGLMYRGRLSEGETVLVHGAGGGTGTAALQIAQACGARTIALVSSAQKAEVATAAGADCTVLSSVDWRAEVLELTGGSGVDVVFDPVGGDRMLDTIRCLAFRGRWVVIGFTGGGVPQIPANRLLLKNVEVVGSYLGGYVRRGVDLATAVRTELEGLLAAGAIRPPVGAVLPFARAGEALRLLADRQAAGKVVICPKRG